MTLEGESQVPCVDEETALDFVRGRLSESDVRRIDDHADGCERCRLALAEAARAFREHWTDAPAAPPAPLTRFVPGDMLSQRYRIIRFIARGGMGEVYEAYDLILGARLAVKTLAATISDDPNAIRRLKQEVNLARLITHPNVCRIFDLGVHEQSGERPLPGVLFITMELVPGTSLGERVRTQGRLSSAQALPIARAIVAGLRAAHRAGIVHRDLKSDNVMLASDEHGGERPVVMDFGLAREASRAPELHSTDGPVMAGTLAYMAPEQVEGKTIGSATDIYALGVVMFEMLTGDLPFRSESPLAAAWKRVTHAAPSVSALAPGVDPSLQRLVAQCLERDPARRPASVEEIERTLGAPEPPTDQRIAPPSGVSFARRVRMVIAGASLLVGLGAAWLAMRWSHPGVAAGAEGVARTATVSENHHASIPVPAAVPPAAATASVVTPTVEGPAAPVKQIPPRHKKGLGKPGGPSTLTSGAGPSPASAGDIPQMAAKVPRSADPDEGFIFPK